MSRLRLLYRSVSVHELLLHEVAVRAGLYAGAGLDVVLEDGTGSRWPAASAAPDAATVAVGGVVAEWLRGDDAWRVDFVATERPLMWVVGAASVDDLLGRRVAVPPLTDMPSRFLRLLLARHGHDLATAVVPVEVHHRPDRLRLLAAGEVDASLLGPEGLTFDRPALFVGDHVRYPTVGLATRPGIAPETARAAAGVGAAAIRALVDDPALAFAAMHALDGAVTEAIAHRVVADVVAPHWRPPAAGDDLGDVPRVAASLGAAAEARSPEATRAFLRAWAEPPPPLPSPPPRV